MTGDADWGDDERENNKGLLSLSLAALISCSYSFQKFNDVFDQKCVVFYD